VYNCTLSERVSIRLIGLAEITTNYLARVCRRGRSANNAKNTRSRALGFRHVVASMHRIPVNRCIKSIRSDTLKRKKGIGKKHDGGRLSHVIIGLAGETRRNSAHGSFKSLRTIRKIIQEGSLDEITDSLTSTNTVLSFVSCKLLQLSPRFNRVSTALERERCNTKEFHRRDCPMHSRSLNYS
jgi:hypothetical protein